MLVAFGGGLSAAASSQEAGTDGTQRVEITGSSIKRISSETSLPVQIITSEDIKKSGVTNVADLIQNLPAMQGFTASSQSVNGLGAGATTASIHDIGEKYTLVLLNGRRMAPLNTGTTVNLNTLPLAAIERVEVLTDGASALYGADAVAGVVNFILRKDATTGELELSGTKPQHPGGGSYNMSITKGFGELDRQGFNVLFAASFDKQLKLDAAQRPFSRSGYAAFDFAGHPYITELASVNAIGANVFLNSPGPNYPADLTDINGPDSAQGGYFNPYLAKNGHCASGQKYIDGFCLFDYPSTVEDIPESTRASLFVSGRLKLSDQAALFTEIMYSHFYMDPRYAPPAQPLQVTQDLYDKDVLPYLTDQTGLTPSQVIPPSDPFGNGPSMNLRLIDAGGRQDRYQTDTLHAVLGADLTLGTWDTTAYYTHSQNLFYDKALSGYMDKTFLYARIADGSFDPFMSAAGEAVQTLAPGVLHYTMDHTRSAIDVGSVRGSTSFGHLDGGAIGVGLGAELMRQSFKDTPSAIEMGNNPLQPDYFDAIVGGTGGAMPFDSKRNSWGVYGELDLPVMKQLDVTASARYDDIAAVKNSEGFDTGKNPIGAVTQGKSRSAETFKLSARLQPMREFLVRGSIGTGFKAPTLADISAPLASGGSTGTHACPWSDTDPNPLRALCHPGAYEYNSATVGNPSTSVDALKPERSTQWTLGFRIEPSDKFSFGADVWGVRIKDQIGIIPEDEVFGNPDLYPGLLVSSPDPISGQPALTFVQQPKNLGNAHFEGIDLDGESRVATPLGRLTTRAHMTYMLKADYQFLPGGDVFSSMDKIGADGKVTFRWIASLSASLEQGNFTHTLVANFKPGYLDKPGGVVDRNPDGTPADTLTGPLETRRVGNYNTFDWQTRYQLTKDFAITGGIRNIFDQDPPFTAQDEVATGNARGYDGRYTDPTGRAFYLSGSYRF